jgi:hypothetical protein
MVGRNESPFSELAKDETTDGRPRHLAKSGCEIIVSGSGRHKESGGSSGTAKHKVLAISFQ